MLLMSLIEVIYHVKVCLLVVNSHFLKDKTYSTQRKGFITGLTILGYHLLKIPALSLILKYSAERTSPSEPFGFEVANSLIIVMMILTCYSVSLTW